MIENKRYTENLKRAEQGDIISMFFVAMSCYDGTAPATHEEQGKLFEYWMTRVAFSDYAPAYRYLGHYYAGCGNDKAAYESYLKGADLGDPFSAYEAAEYFAGNDMNTYFESLLDALRPKAIEYYKKAYSLGYSSAASRLRAMGESVPDGVVCFNEKEKEKLELASLGLMYYEFEIGHFYLFNEEKKNEQLAFSYIKRAADAGFLSAVYFMGLGYYKGLFGVKDKAKALEWFRAATNPELIGYYDGCSAAKEAAKMVEKLS